MARVPRRFFYAFEAILSVGFCLLFLCVLGEEESLSAAADEGSALCCTSGEGCAWRRFR